MNVTKLYPVFKDYVWGGSKLKESYGKQTDQTPCAESWELSFHPDGLTKLEDGKTLAETVTKKDLGTNAQNFSFFPTLIKLIDAKQDLSVQVHPSDDYALTHENSYGKTEMWYIVEADEGAGIYLGFSRDVTAEEYRQAIAEERLTDLLNFYEVKAGECYFIPAGTIHAIGRGCLICEIQQNSNLTYRVYDYGRRDQHGNLRSLHVDQALKVTNLHRHIPTQTQADLLGCSKYFHVRKVTVRGAHASATDGKSFHALTCVRGEGKIDRNTVKAGDSFFIPADHGEYTLTGNMELILTEIRQYHVRIKPGDTFITGSVIDDTGCILAQEKISAELEQSADHVAQTVARLCQTLLNQLALTASDVEGIEMEIPNTDSGEQTICTNDLMRICFEIGSAVEQLTGLPVKLPNDAGADTVG